MQKLYSKCEVTTPLESYPVYIGQGILSNLGQEIAFLGRNYSSVFIITDDHVDPLYSGQVEASLAGYEISISKCVIPSGEQSKNITVATRCWEKMMEVGIDRNSLVIAIGGGCVLDLAGFVSACFMRGVDVIHVPTTLLAMVDASIGGKTAVNLHCGKNMVGAYHQPAMVMVDVDTLKSLPQREYTSGLAEVVKAAFISDLEFFQYLEREIKGIKNRNGECLYAIVERSIAIKAQIVSEDTHDRGIRAILNWGHTFGHAIEGCTHYETYLHGEAVSIGMSTAGVLSTLVCGLDSQTLERLDLLLKAFGLPVTLPNIPDEALIGMMKLDKKRVQGTVSCIVAKAIGHVEKSGEISDEVLNEALRLKRSRDSR